MRKLLSVVLISLMTIGGIYAQSRPIASVKQQSKKGVIQQEQGILQQMSKMYAEKFAKEKAYAVKQAKEKGWALIIDKDGVYMELMKVSKEGTPIYFTTYNANAAISTRANTLHNGGSLGLNIEGQGMTAYVWDGGIARITHQEYDGAGGNNRYSVGDGTSSTHYHSAHVTGTIIASGFETAAKGMAPQAHAIGYDWNDDVSEATTAAGNGMLLSNHSYGYDATAIPNDWFGQYSNGALEWDNIMYNAPYYLAVYAAGNDGDDDSSNGDPLDGNSSYDKLSGPACSKNTLVVANAQDANIDGSDNLTSVSINSSSSEGPTDDYRIKPDITGNGTNVYSTYDGADDDYASITGTSMASPNVTGTLLLLQQHYNNIKGSYMKAATLKGLALHTADDAGAAGPDAIFGWGLLNGKKAAQAITDEGDASVIMESSLANSGSYSIDVYAMGGEDLIASISWTDPVGTEHTDANNNTPVLVNDLDIRVTESTNTYLPYKLTGITTNAQADNTVDPYERVNVTNPTAGTLYTITVTHKGTLSSSQDYSLIITGITGNTAKPNTNFEVNTPSTLLYPVPVLEGDIVTYNNLTTGIVDSYAWTFNGGTPNTVSTLDPGNITYNTAGLYDVTLLAHSNANGDSTLTKTNRVDVLDPSVETCKTVSQFYGNSTLYGTSGGGYFSGTNEYNFTKFSDKFENYTPYNKLTGGRIYWGKVTNGTSPNVTFAVWQDNGSGIPGTLLESKDIPLASVLTDFTNDGYTDIVFDNEVILPAGAFYFGLIMPNDGTNGDTLAIITNNDADGPDNTAYLEYNGTWQSYFDVTGSLTVMHAIFPTLCYIPNPPVATDFVADQTLITSGTTVNFTDLTVNNPVSWAWDFGDGNTSTQQNPSNTYASDGLYTVTLTTTGAGGSSDTETKNAYIVVDSQTYCASTYTEAGSEYISNVTFNTINNNSGDAPTDGYEDYTSISTIVNPDATYALSVTVNTAGNYTDYIEAYFDWNDDGDWADAGEMVDLGTQNNQTAGVVTANVTIPTGASQSAIRMRINIEYNNVPGPCDVDHSSEWGETEDYTIIISPPTPAPVAAFSGTPLTICPGESVTFTDASTNTPTSWAWNFGDSNTSTSQNPSNTYATAGTYTVVLTATNAGGSDTETKTAYVTVSATTAITTQPSSTTACLGDNVTFTVTATGSNLSYQWKKDATNVGTDNASYSITGIASADAADYTCIVSGDCGNVTSNAATLTVNPTTTITGQPADNTVCEGDNITFTVTATGSNLSYQWKRGTTNVGTDNASYSITGIASADAADYTCVVSGDCGNVTSNAATLTVNPITAITGQPADNTVCEGDNITFTVTATGSNLSYQWKKGTTNVGTDNASYAITGVASSDAANYTCVVSGDCGNVTSNTATLIVNPLPTAASSASATSLTICNGESTDLTYSGGSGTTFNWYTSSCGGSLVGAGNNLTVNPTANTTYYGRWENSCGNSTCQTVTITVNNMPNLTTSATNASCGNTDGTVTVSATGGTGTYSYLWDDASYQNTATATGLAQGVYNVTVTSGACSATDNATVNEDGAPTVNVSASEIEICDGETTVLTATGADSYSWSPATGLDATTGAIVNATPTSDITYTVTGTTAGCSASANVSITVNHLAIVGFTIDTSGEPVIDFTNTTTGADSYSWDLGDGTTENTTDVSHEYVTNNTFTVVLSATNGCGTVTSEQDVTITNIGVVSLDKASIVVYPNPVENTLNITLPIENVKIQLVNMDGKTLETLNSLNSKKVEINVENLASGIYNLIITTENNEHAIVKVVKE